MVTGGASGIGRALCLALHQQGAKLAICDIDSAGARALADELSPDGSQAVAYCLDVRDSQAVRLAVEAIAARFGRIDLLFNNAGIAVGGEFQNLEPESVQRIYDVNLLGATHVMHAAYLQMLTQREGHIVNIASMYGLVPGILQSVYAATKHGLTALTLSVAPEARDRGVRLTLVCPGYIDTALFESGSYGGSLTAAEALERIPFRRIDAQSAAARILRGVQKQRLIVVFPAYVRALWWLERLSPRLLAAIYTVILRAQRKRFGDGSTSSGA